MVPQGFILTTMWHSVDSWSECWFQFDSSVQMNVICLTISHRQWTFAITYLKGQFCLVKHMKGWKGCILFWQEEMQMFKECRLCQATNVTVLFGIHKSFPLLLCFSLWAKHDGHSLGFPCGILSVTFWLAEAAWVIGSPKPSVSSSFTAKWGETIQIREDFFPPIIPSEKRAHIDALSQDLMWAGCLQGWCAIDVLLILRI